MCSEGIIDRYVNFYTDFAFKKLFGTEMNKSLLISFLNALFHGKEEIEDITYLNAEQMGTQEYDRRAVFDVYCKNTKGEMFIIEMQKGEQQFFKDRSIFYSTFAIREQAPRGYWNYDLKGVYTVGILNFRIFDDDEVRHDVQLVDMKTKELFYDKLAFIYLEMPKFVKEEEELETMFDKWLYAIRHLDGLMRRPEALREKVFARLFEAAEIAGFDKQDRIEYEDSLKNLRDWFSTMQTAELKGEAKGLERGLEQGRAEGHAKGHAEGRAEGEKTKALEIARSLKSLCVPHADIAQATGLSEEEIAGL